MVNLKEVTAQTFLAFDTVIKTSTVVVHTPHGGHEDFQTKDLKVFPVLKSKEWDCTALKYS